jgi:hypothetical protein
MDFLSQIVLIRGRKAGDVGAQLGNFTVHARANP